jgi:hypothetical protein
MIRRKTIRRKPVRKTHKRKSSRRYRYTRKGGSYNDATTVTYEGVAIDPTHTTVTVNGQTMSLADWKQYENDRDRNGMDY